ncbi:MAG: PIN domain-containing protein [Prevotellaceae bacterium]|jgi:predicted nucleic acid-binding protein|nr:PIN domain-containing protein [Prevotellaceae bacterium]
MTHLIERMVYWGGIEYFVYICGKIIAMKQRIYIDTSVIGGYYDTEFENATRQLFSRITAKEFDVYFSEINEAELQNAPQRVKAVKELIPPDCYHYIGVIDEVETLTQLYISEKALGKASENDAYHIALASVNRIDCLISWNFKHIVNYDKIKMFNAINMRFGYPLIDIRLPLEFLKI